MTPPTGIPQPRAGKFSGLIDTVSRGLKYLQDIAVLKGDGALEEEGEGTVSKGEPSEQASDANADQPFPEQGDALLQQIDLLSAVRYVLGCVPGIYYKGSPVDDILVVD